MTFPDAISIQEEGPVLVQIGARHAFNLDGGCSSFLDFYRSVMEENCRPLPAVILARPRK